MSLRQSLASPVLPWSPPADKQMSTLSSPTQASRSRTSKTRRQHVSTLSQHQHKPETDALPGKLDLCRGATFEDNTARVQTFTAGQQVPITVDLPIPHEGPCNVSIVDTRTNSVLGAPLIEFATYADENLAQLPANNTAFSVTIPQMQAGQCVQPGACTMQWFWFGTNAQQTYESCIDFVMA